ncbi:hypothetical protein LINPERHAP1_LOCUS27084 [Linum perenne]
MGPSTSYDHPQQLSCEIAIHQSKNVEDFMTTNKYYSKPHGNLFVRYYLSSGNSNNNNRIQLETREIPSSSGHLSWNESFSLDCSGTQDSINDLKSSSVAFELRWRPSSRSSILGCRAGSKLVGSGEVMWRSVMESSGMEIETWVVMCPKNSKRCDGVKPPSVKIGMRVPPSVKIEMRVVGIPTSNKKKNESYECGCSCRHSGYHSCGDYDALALVAAFEAL